MFSKEFIWNCSIQFTQVLSVSSSFTFQPSAPPISTDSKADEEQLNNISTTEKESNEDDDSDYVDPTDAAQLKPDGNSSATTTAAKKKSFVFAKNVLSGTIPKVMFRSKFYYVVVSEHLSQDLALVFLLYFNIYARFEQFEVKF